MVISKKLLFNITLIGTMLTAACNNPSSNNQSSDKKDTAQTADYAKESFGYDLSFLKKYDSGLVVLGNGDAQVIVSPKYQAKVFTSTAEGVNGKSFGWVHYKAFDGPLDAHMNGYGGENRLWLGPEGGVFSLFFPKDAKMEFTNWKTPAAYDNEAWELTVHNENSAHLQKDMRLVNYAGTVLSIHVDRSVRILNQKNIDEILGITTGGKAIKYVGYQTDNTLTNTGAESWTEQTGMPCIWMLDMFPPSASVTIVVPYKKEAETAPATTDYFGAIPADRIKLDNGVLFFKADGKQRGKLGIHPKAAKNMAGSYDAEHHVLTITLFDIDNNAKYLNQEWKTDKPAFSGDAVNAYNDGPLADGGQMGHFYEIESVSPAAFLQPGASLSHKHSVFHFTGNEVSLNTIAQQLLGVSIETIKNTFK